MKKPKLGDYLLWKGEPAKIVCRADEPTYTIELLEEKTCTNCGKKLGKHQFSVIPASPLFQNNAEPIQTLKDE